MGARGLLQGSLPVPGRAHAIASQAAGHAEEQLVATEEHRIPVLLEAQLMAQEKLQPLRHLAWAFLFGYGRQKTDEPQTYEEKDTPTGQKSIDPAPPCGLTSLRRGVHVARDRSPQRDRGGPMRRRGVPLLVLAGVLTRWVSLAGLGATSATPWCGSRLMPSGAGVALALGSSGESSGEPDPASIASAWRRGTTGPRSE